MKIKRLIGLLLAAVMVLMPMTAFAEEAELGSDMNPYQLSTMDVRFAVYVEPGDTAWVQVDDCNGSTLSVGYATSSAYMIAYCRQTYYPDADSADNTMTLTMVDGADMFSVYNAGEEAVTVYMALAAGAGGSSSGTMDNPELVTLAPNMFGGIGAYMSTELGAGNQGYYYSCTVPSDGKLAVSIGAFDAEYNAVGWMYNVHNLTKGRYGDMHFSDDEEPLITEELEVSAGDVIEVFITTYDPENMWNAPAGMVSVNFELSAIGSWGNPAKVGTGTFVAELAAGNQGYYYVWTATESGTMTVTMDDASGWTYAVNGELANGNYTYGETRWYDDDPAVPSETYTVSAGDAYTIMVGTYDAENMWSTPAGNVNWTLSFVPGEGGGEGGGSGNEGGDVGGDVEDTEITYVHSEIAFEVGTNDYALSGDHTYTIFAFEPSETGKYIFTSDMPIGIVSYNGMWITIEPNAATVADTTLEWTCGGVGQSIWVAVKGGEDIASITIEWMDPGIVEIPVIIYENKTEPQPFTYNGDANALLYVDTFDDVVDIAVLGKDGFYHLGDAYGPILYADLNDTLMSLSTVNSYGQLKKTFYENGEIVSKVDYTEAYMAYEACMDKNGLYPLTEDLMTIFREVGDDKEWYGSSGWVGGDLEDAWMFACYYVEGEHFEPEPEPILGDVDEDGEITTLDYMMLKSYILGTYDIIAQGLENADVDCDGEISLRDYMMLKRHILGTYDIYSQTTIE